MITQFCFNSWYHSFGKMDFCILRSSLTKYLTSILVRKSLDLIESLLRLAEVGQYEQVKQLFSFPIKHCPDMLVLALLQINTSWHTLRHELISTLMPIFLGNHPNSAIILHYAWHGQVRHEHFFLLIIDILWRMFNRIVNLKFMTFMESGSSIKLTLSFSIMGVKI